ncbi:hypothetical protein B0T21DRAFT_357410 [Apiosordaria backusii]|uniref:Uncharacterized protein n=1 Tax=Apiosordaria backusii TaxID=314023 RepID=A0AA40K827_9PEZI|nr:hypothetical protein B0T21DRAFT_357410 [Apiosordaria backusii]
MLSSVCLTKMDNLTSASSGSSMSPTSTDKETIKLNPKARLSIFATLRRKTSRIFVNKNNSSHTPESSTDHQPQQSWSTEPNQRRSWFNTVGGRFHQRQSIRDHFEHDRRAETPTPTTPTPYSARDGPTPNSPVRRLLRTSSSMFLSLRGRFHQDSLNSPSSHEEDHDDDEESDYASSICDTDIPKAPVLALPATLKARGPDRRSSFQLGVQKAVQDTVDKNFSLDSACDKSVSLSPRKRPLLPPLDTIASMNSSMDCLTSPSMSTYPHPSRTPRECSSDSPTLPSTSQPDSARTSLGITVNCNSNSLSSPETFSSSVSIPSRQRAVLSNSSWSLEAPVCSACGSASQSRLMERRLCELNQLRDEELEALFRNKLGALSLASLASSRGHFGPGSGPYGSEIGAGGVAAELGREVDRVNHDHGEDDDRNTTMSILEGDSSLCASTPKRSLREELLRVGEMSQVCGGSSIVLEESMVMVGAGVGCEKVGA